VRDGAALARFLLENISPTFLRETPAASPVARRLTFR